MSEMSEETKKRFKRAMELLAQGKNPDGTPIQVAKATREAFQATRKFADELRIGQAVAAERLVNKRFVG